MTADAPKGVPLDPALVSTSADLRDFLEAARSWGVAPTRFLGREPGRTTTYELDEHGRVRSSTTTSDPEWTDLDTRLAMALHAYESELCPTCRHPLAETTAPEAEERFVPGESIRCHRCTAASQAAALTQNNPHSHALLHTVRVRDLPTPEPAEPAEED